MTFGEALEQIKEGTRVSRQGWNGKGMWLELIPADCWSASLENRCVVEARKLPWIGMKTADNGFVPWLASQTDLLASDWEKAGLK